MKLSSLAFRDTFKIRCDYGRMVAFFRSRLDDVYFKGYTHRDDTQLFYFSGFFWRPLSSNIPVVQLNFKNQSDDNGQIEVRFKLVDFALIVFGLANASIFYAAIFTDDVSAMGAMLFLLATYSFLLFIYLKELAYFRRDIEPLIWDNDNSATLKP